VYQMGNVSSNTLSRILEYLRQRNINPDYFWIPRRNGYIHGN
jgi:hypothetical protein